MAPFTGTAPDQPTPADRSPGKHGRYRTWQAAAVRHALNEIGNYATALQIHHRLLSRSAPIGIATVYRHLRSLVESGAVEAILTGAGRQYRLNNPTQHSHQLVCQNCYATVALTALDESWIEQAARHNGFQLIGHSIELVGLCRSCVTTTDAEA